MMSPDGKGKTQETAVPHTISILNDAPHGGDTLFVGAIGRPDLAGHQAGSLCGAGLSGKPSSTLGFEKRWNPTLALDKAAFVDALTRDIPPRPADMDAMVRANLGLAP